MSEVIRKSVTLLTAIMPNEDKEEWSATEVSQKLDIPIQTVHRLLSSLTEYGFVFKNHETKKFRLGLTLMQLGLSIRDNLLVRNSALPVMEKLMKKTKECVYLTIAEGYEGVFIDCVGDDLFLKIAEPIGMRTPLCNGASKKVILAYMNRNTRKNIIHYLLEKDKISDIQKLENELKTIKEWGSATSFGETTKGTVSVAAPIFSWEDKVVGSISLVGPGTRITEHEAKYVFSSEIRKAAEEISEDLGWIKQR